MVERRDVGGRIRVTYMDGEPDLRLNGIDPQASSMQFMTFAGALASIQTSTVEDGFLISEFELTTA